MSRRNRRAVSRQKSEPNRFLVALVALVGVAGLTSALFCAIWLHEIWSISARQDVVRTLPDVAHAVPGDRAILEGRIAESVPARHGEFVAYVREASQKRGWRLVGQATPPLVVETTSGGTYTIGNSDYRFDRLLSGWTEFARDDAPPTFAVGGIRIQGLVAGGPVTAVGRLVPAGDGTLHFHADSVVGHTRGAYFDRLVEARASLWTLVAASAALALLGVYGGWRGVRWIMRD